MAWFAREVTGTLESEVYGFTDERGHPLAEKRTATATATASVADVGLAVAARTEVGDWQASAKTVSV